MEEQNPSMSSTLLDIQDKIREQSKTLRGCQAPDTGIENRLEICSLRLDEVCCLLDDLSMDVQVWEVETHK